MSLALLVTARACCVGARVIEDFDDSKPDACRIVGEVVGGLRVRDDVMMIVDDDGVRKELPMNVIAMLVSPMPIVGPVLFIGVDGAGETRDIPLDFIEMIASLVDASACRTVTVSSVE